MAINSRERILRKIQQGLAAGAVSKPFPEVAHVPYKEVYLQPGDKELEFAQRFIALGGKFCYCASYNDFLEQLLQLYESNNWKKVFCADKNIQQKVQEQGLELLQDVQRMDEDADACITGCEALVARTGSAVFSSAQYYGRTSTIYFPVHIIIAQAGQIVADIPDALDLMQQKYGNNLPTMINFNTGPSRTADIEKTLVVGIHGPKEVYCFLINE